MPNGGAEEDAFPPVEPEDEEEVVVSKPDISPLANKILEGLRGDAFLLARDVGLDALTSEEGLEDLLNKMKAFVFPRRPFVTPSRRVHAVVHEPTQALVVRAAGIGFDHDAE